MKYFLYIIEDSVVFFVVKDFEGMVLLLLLIINGVKLVIFLDMIDVFIECMVMDLNKVKIVLNIMVIMFSEYCVESFIVESVDVVDCIGKEMIYFDFMIWFVDVDVDYINKCIGMLIDC